MDHDFRIVVVGGGIAGLAAAIALRRLGRSIVVLEKSSMLREVGALLSLQPNASRIVAQRNITPFLLEAGPVVDEAFRVFDTNGRLVTNIPCKSHSGAHRVIFHRQDLHNALKSAAVSDTLAGKPVQIRTAAAVSHCDTEKGIVYLRDGTAVEGDLVIGADGIHSTMRDSVLENLVHPIPTGLSAYRLLIDVEKIGPLPCSEDVFNPTTRVTTMIIGNDRRVILGPGRNAKVLGLVALVPDHQLEEISASDSWTSEGSLESLLNIFSDFPAWLLKLFKAAPDMALWQLRDINPLETWVRGRAIVIGDAAHAMLPTQGQGASQSIEDAEALAAFFSDIEDRPSREKIEEKLLQVFESRCTRARRIQNYSRQQARSGTKPGSTEVVLSPDEFLEYNLEYYGAKDWLEKQRMRDGNQFPSACT